MIIKDVVNLAKHSELAGVAVKNDIDAIVAFINMGMLELYTRFAIKVEEHLITLDGINTNYEMPNDFMYATHAYGEGGTHSSEKVISLAINDDNDPLGIFFIDWNTVQIPYPTEGSFISIIYVRKPTPITVVQAEDGTTELDLPDTLVDALLSYVGYRGTLGVKSDKQHGTSAHWSRFERNCKKAEEYGVAVPIDSMNMSKRLSDRGFV